MKSLIVFSQIGSPHPPKGGLHSFKQKYRIENKIKAFVHYLASMNRLAEIIFNKSIDDVSAETLEQLTNKYPFFNAGHLLAIQKAKKENSSAISQKASLHFHPLLFNESSVVNNAQPTFSNSVPEVLEQVNVSQPIAINETPTITETQIELNKEEIIVEPESPAADVQFPASETEQEATNNVEVITNNQEPETSNQQPATNPEPPTPNSDPLAFEPFHTVDYFASQGIKFKIDENPTDKFSKQLKSFTEWLKTMKKLPTGEVIPATTHAASVEQKVEQLAETSLNKADVITEAMAEVWEKQGNPEKAIEIYQKLSLLEPSKSAYFATRISDLKKTN